MNTCYLKVGQVTCSLGLSTIKGNQEIKAAIRVADGNSYKSKIPRRNEVIC